MNIWTIRRIWFLEIACNDGYFLNALRELLFNCMALNHPSLLRKKPGNLDLMYVMNILQGRG